MRSTASVIVNKSAEHVFATMTRLPDLDRWLAWLQRPKQTSSGQFGLHTTFSCRVNKTSAGSQRLEFHVHAYEPGKLFAFTYKDGPYHWGHAFILDTVKLHSTVQHRVNLTSPNKGKLLGILLSWPVRYFQIRSKAAADLEKLKTFAEKASKATGVARSYQL